MNEIIFRTGTNEIGLSGNTYLEYIAGYVTNTNTLLYYNFNNSTATNFNGTVGTTHGITYGNGIYSEYANFPAPYTSAEPPTPCIDLNFNIDCIGTSITFLSWIYIDLSTTGLTNGNDFPLISHGAGDTDNSNKITIPNNLMGIQWTSFNTWASNGGWWQISTGKFNQGWMFVGVVFNKVTNQCSFYYTQNGNYATQTNVAWTQYSGTLKGVAPFQRVGASGPYWSNSFFTGKMAEIIVENRVWSDTEIYNYYTQSCWKTTGNY